jgi:hypothetical protein
MKLVEKAELRRRTPHAIRHTFVSLLLQNGESLAFVQKQAGYKSMDITLNVYGHLLPQGNREAVDRLDDHSQPKPGQGQRNRSVAVPRRPLSLTRSGLISLRRKHSRTANR